MCIFMRELQIRPIKTIIFHRDEHIVKWRDIMVIIIANDTLFTVRSYRMVENFDKTDT